MENKDNTAGRPSAENARQLLDKFWNQHKGFILLIILPLVLIALVLLFILHDPKTKKNSFGINATVPLAKGGDTLSLNDKEKAYKDQDKQKAELIRQQQTAAAPVNFDLLPPAAQPGGEPARYAAGGRLSPELVAQLQKERQERQGLAPNDWERMAAESAADSVLTGASPSGGLPREKAVSSRSRRPVTKIKQASSFNAVMFDEQGVPIKKAVTGNYNTSEISKSSVNASLLNVRANVLKNYTVREGSIISFRTQQPVTVQSVYIPSNTIISGRVSLSQNRMKVSVPSVNIGGRVEEISFQIYDQDGLQGMRLPMGLEDKVNRKASLDNQLDNVISQGQQAAGAIAGSSSIMTASAASGIGAGIIRAFKNTKGSVVKVNITEGYKVMLKPIKSTGTGPTSF